MSSDGGSPPWDHTAYYGSQQSVRDSLNDSVDWAIQGGGDNSTALKGIFDQHLFSTLRWTPPHVPRDTSIEGLTHLLTRAREERRNSLNRVDDFVTQWKSLEHHGNESDKATIAARGYEALSDGMQKALTEEAIKEALRNKFNE